MEERLKEELKTWKTLLANARTYEGEEMAMRAIKDIEQQLAKINEE